VRRRRIEVRLPAEARSIASARRALARLSDLVPRGTLDDARLLVSELVTNSVRHARAPGGPIEVRAAVDGTTLRVEITDRGPGFEPPPPRAPSTVEASGWGLYLVERVADRWGTTSADGRTCVWFELDLGRGR
jgi:anti-sigma regulatory factor (Ser/Thr protein kinase)